MERSSNILRQSVSPALPSGLNAHLDKHAKLVLGNQGPQFIRSNATDQMALREITEKTWYTKEFAELVWRQALIERGHMVAVRRQLVLRFQESGNEIADLIPQFKGALARLLEDSCSAPFRAGASGGLIS